MSSMKNIILFTFLSLISLSISQNIITSWHYDKVQMYDIQKITKILTTELKSKVTSLPDFEADSIKISSLLLTDVQVSLYDSYLNYNTGLLLFSPNKVTLSFNFSYAIDTTKNSAQFDIKISTLKIRIKNEKSTQTQTSTATMSAGESDFAVYGISDKEISNKVKAALYKGFGEKNILNENIASKIDLITYYNNFYSKKKSYEFTASKFLGSKQYSINLNRFIGFCEDITAKINTGLCYYSGELDEDKTDKTAAPISNEKFVQADDLYKMFINKDLINTIANKIVTAGIAEKVYKQGTAGKSLIYDFTVKSLKNYFKGLDSYADDKQWDTKVKINDLKNNYVNFDVKFNIDGKENVFAIKVDADIKLTVSVTNTVKFNLCLDSTVTKDIKKISGDGVDISNIEGLKEAIDGSFGGVALCFSQSGITMRDYFSVIKSGYIQDEGVYLEGNQLYQ